MDKTYPRSVLLAVTGISPQIVTETMYALYHTQGVWPTEIQLLTTTVGRDIALEAFVGAESELDNLARDLDMPAIPFDENNITLIPGAAGAPSKDARSEAGQMALADFILAQVQDLSNDPDTQIFASMSGGRKTMGFFLGYALSLYGRKQDFLLHVLAGDRYEQHPQFFYPTPYDKLLTLTDGSQINAKNAELELSRIPFIRMRDEVPERLISGKTSFSEVIDTLNRPADKLSIVFQVQDRRIVCDGETVRFPPKEFAFYLWQAKRVLEGEGPMSSPVYCRDSLEAYLQEYALFKDSVAIEEVRATHNGTMTDEFFSQTRSKIRRKLVNTLGKKRAGYYEIGVIQDNDAGNTADRFGLRVPAHAIEINY